MYQAIGCGSISRLDEVLLHQKLDPGTILLLATDGVFKNLSDPCRALADLAAMHHRLTDLVDAVVKLGAQHSSDDVSCAALRPPGALGARPVYWAALLILLVFWFLFWRVS